MCDALRANASRGAGSVLTSGVGNITEWTTVSEDKTQAVGFLMQKLVAPNSQFDYYKARGLNPEAEYSFINRALKCNIKEFGSLVNMISPVHIKQDSLVHNVVAKFVKMDLEREACSAYGDVMMYNGVNLKQAFGGTGYSDQVRHFQDFSSRIYFMEQMKGEV
jgi:alpha-galactosidase